MAELRSADTLGVSCALLSLLSVTQIGNAGSCDFSFFAGWIEPNQFFIELLRVGEITLGLFKGGRLKEFLCFVGAAK